MTKPKRNTHTIELLRQMAAASPEIELVEKVKRHADAIASSMTKLHGKPYKVRIDHDCGLVLITVDY